MDTVTRLTSNVRGSRPETKRWVRAQGETPQIMWIPGHVGINGNERADEAAKKGAMAVEHPIKRMITVAAARAMDSELWSSAKSEGEWGRGRLREWPLRLVRTLIRIRQATGACPLCEGGMEASERKDNRTHHIMCECNSLEEARRRSGLFNPAARGESRGHAGWNVWLGKDEISCTEKFVKEVSRAWKAVGRWPMEGSLEVPWNLMSTSE